MNAGTTLLRFVRIFVWSASQALNVDDPARPMVRMDQFECDALAAVVTKLQSLTTAQRVNVIRAVVAFYQLGHRTEIP